VDGALKRKHVTLSIVWEEYMAREPDGYRYSRFCELYRGWQGVTMRRSHAAGEKLFIDYAGDGVPIVVDRLTGENPQRRSTVVTEDPLLSCQVHIRIAAVAGQPFLQPYLLAIKSLVGPAAARRDVSPYRVPAKPPGYPARSPSQFLQPEHGRNLFRFQHCFPPRSVESQRT
jgi:hypothetical protein